MSRSNPDITNPATRFFEWKGGKGEVSFYDKENKQNVTVPLPFEFLVIDELATVTGYCEPDESGYWSNEVRSIAREDLTVKTAKGTKYVGKYKNEQGVVQMPNGAKYAKSVYMIYKTRDGYQIGNIKMGGSALTSWIDFTGSYVVGNGKVTITGAAEATKGTNTYWVPTFEYKNATVEEDAEAIRLDKELQIYLGQYLAAANFNRSNDEHETSKYADIGKASDEQVADFQARKTAKQSDDEAISLYQQEAQSQADEFHDEPIDLNSIPF